MTLLSIESPCWHDYRELLQQLLPDLTASAEAPDSVPSCAALNQLLTGAIQQRNGKPIRFVPANELPDVSYEAHIFQTGEVSTRQNSWHDLFNALVWARFPRIKAAMNARHFAAMQQSMSAERGPIRDALTLFDECGVVVVGDQEATLRTMAARDWRSLFQAHREGWQNHLRVFIVGHALLEKFMQPYKAITAQALMYRAPPEFMKSDRLAQRTYVDALMAEQLAAGMLLRSSAELSPLPLMGIPGWWAEGPQDDGFYADEKVFRPAPNFFKPATVLYLDSRRAFGGLE